MVICKQCLPADAAALRCTNGHIGSRPSKEIYYSWRLWVIIIEGLSLLQSIPLTRQTNKLKHKRKGGEQAFSCG